MQLEKHLRTIHVLFTTRAFQVAVVLLVCVVATTYKNILISYVKYW